MGTLTHYRGGGEPRVGDEIELIWSTTGHLRTVISVSHDKLTIRLAGDVTMDVNPKSYRLVRRRTAAQLLRDAQEAQRGRPDEREYR